MVAADKTRLQDLDEAARKYIAWQSILDEKETLNLDPQQEKQAETQKAAADGAVTARIPETYQWLLVPVQTSPQALIDWQAHKLSGQDALAVRVSKKLRNDELLLTAFAGTRLKMELDRVPLWRGYHVAVKQLAEDFGRYPYLPRLTDISVLVGAIHDGTGLLTWQQDSFAYADSFDETATRYRGLRAGQRIALSNNDTTGLLVKGDVARAQLDAVSAQLAASAAQEGKTTAEAESPQVVPGRTGNSTEAPSKPAAEKPKRFYGTVTLDAARVGRDAGRVAKEVIAHLAGIVGSNVKVTLDIQAEIPSGAPDNVVRTVTENSRTLKFTSQGFEKD